MRRISAAAPAIVAALAFVPATSPAAAQIPLIPPPAYYRPALSGGMAFPVARSNFFSWIEFGDDWHAPRFRLVDGVWRLVGRHEGIDIGAEKGTPVLSITSGTVERVGWTFYSGTRVGVRGADGRYYFYAHLSAVEAGIAPGAPVGAGEVLGRVGNTGYGDPGTEDQFPPHLHVGIEDGDRWVTPYPLLVRLYAAAVEAGRRDDARLRRIAGSGDRARWDAVRARLYMGISLP
ncbi:MAG TPA: M23 family metallopeptidase [Actinomycetota bacterium]|nr:M23 family metallopeptidase [Actinomycetota bacterium]